MRLPRALLWQWTAALLTLLCITVGGVYYYRLTNRILWSVVHVSGDFNSGDAHLLEFPADNHVVLIDTGFDRFTRRDLIPYLDKEGIDHIDQLIVTHAHRNHYGGVVSLLRHLKKIDDIYFNAPPQSRCDRETWITGCDYQHVLATRRAIQSSDSRLRTLARGDLLYQDPERDITLQVVYVHDGVSPPIGNTDINDTSAVLRLSYGATSVLFTADLGKSVGNYLQRNDFALQADIVTAPHHGVESAASNAFLDRVSAKLMIVSDSGRQWLGVRGRRMRDYARSHGIPVYVTGLHGNIAISLGPDGYSVATETTPERP